MKLFFKNDIIEFYCAPEFFGVIPEPTSAFSKVPTWYKKLPMHVENGKRDHFGAKAMTAKKCIPLLDAMSLGFIIPTFADVNIRVNKDGSLIDVGEPTKFGPVIQFHDKAQLGGKASPTYPGDAIKFINHWVVKTAPGYSTLFTPCLNHLETRFTLLSGVVDTDKYPKEVNFPGILNVKDTEIYLPAGTPLMSVIPFKRADIPRSVKPRVMTEKEKKVIFNIRDRQDTRAHVYTNELRESRK